MAMNQGRRPAHGAPRHSAPRAGVPAIPTGRVSSDDSISTIRAGQGARVTTRKNASQAADRARRNAEERYRKRHPEERAAGGPPRTGKNVAVLVAAAIAVLVLLFFVGRCVTGALVGSPAEKTPEGETIVNGVVVSNPDAEEPSGQEANAQTSEQVAADESITYHGLVYSLTTQEDGTLGLSRVEEGGEPALLFTIEGTPAALMRYQDVFLIPESGDGGWDVICYVVDGHAGSSYVAGQDGNKVSGSGSIESAVLEGTAIKVTDSTGATTDVSLV